MTTPGLRTAVAAVVLSVPFGFVRWNLSTLAPLVWWQGVWEMLHRIHRLDGSCDGVVDARRANTLE